MFKEALQLQSESGAIRMAKSTSFKPGEILDLAACCIFVFRMGFTSRPKKDWWKKQLNYLIKRLRTDRGKEVAKGIFIERFGGKYKGPYARDVKQLLRPVTDRKYF